MVTALSSRWQPFWMPNLQASATNQLLISDGLAVCVCDVIINWGDLPLTASNVNQPLIPHQDPFGYDLIHTFPCPRVLSDGYCR